jgi:hypothetical protein
MNNSFAVAGPLLDALHLPECEGAEFELGIRVVMKRHKENRARQWDSNAYEFSWVSVVYISLS